MTVRASGNGTALYLAQLLCIIVIFRRLVNLYWRLCLSRDVLPWRNQFHEAIQFLRWINIVLRKPFLEFFVLIFTHHILNVEFPSGLLIILLKLFYKFPVISRNNYYNSIYRTLHCVKCTLKCKSSQLNQIYRLCSFAIVPLQFYIVIKCTQKVCRLNFSQKCF